MYGLGWITGTIYAQQPATAVFGKCLRRPPPRGEAPVTAVRGRDRDLREPPGEGSDRRDAGDRVQAQLGPGVSPGARGGASTSELVIVPLHSTGTVEYWGRRPSRLLVIKIVSGCAWLLCGRN